MQPQCISRGVFFLKPAIYFSLLNQSKAAANNVPENKNDPIADKKSNTKFTSKKADK